MAGRIDGLRPDAELAVAVNGRVAATTRAYPRAGRLLYAALIPPGSLRDGPNAITVLEVLRDGGVRAIGGVGTGGR